MNNPNQSPSEPVRHVVDVGVPPQLNDLTPSEQNGERARTTYEIQLLIDALKGTSDPTEQDAIRTAIGGYTNHLDLISQGQPTNSLPNKVVEKPETVTSEGLLDDMNQRSKRLEEIREAIKERQQVTRVQGRDGQPTTLEEHALDVSIRRP